MITHQQIATALTQHQYTCHYQPQVRSCDESICGVEALLRLSIPGLGLVMPANFLPQAFEMGYDDRIFFTVLEQSLRAIKLIGKDLTLSVNVSHSVLKDPQNVDLVANLLLKHTFPAGRLMLELSENDPFTLDLHSHLNAYRKLGIKISVDDFGVQHSCLNKVINVRPDEVKFDKSLVNSDNLQSLNSIVTYFKSIGIETVAEGVENKEKAEYLKQIGFDQLQGFYYSKPVNEQNLIAMFTCVH